MNLEHIYAKWDESEKDKYSMISLTGGILKKNKSEVIKSRWQNGRYQGMESEEIELMVFKDTYLEWITKKQ